MSLVILLECVCWMGLEEKIVVNCGGVSNANYIHWVACYSLGELKFNVVQRGTVLFIYKRMMVTV